MSKPIVIICAFILPAVACIYGLNYVQLQSQMNRVIEGDPRNSGVEVSVHFKNYVNPSILIYDLRAVSGTNSKADVSRVLLQFAERMQTKEFDPVELCFRGKTKFKIDGDYFRGLGEEHPWQNPIYTMRTFPQKSHEP